MPWGLAIGAAAGLAKNELVDKPNANIENKLNATKERYSPWTREHGGPMVYPNPFDAALQYGAAGAEIGRAVNPQPTEINLSTGSTDLNNADPSVQPKVGGQDYNLGKPLKNSSDLIFNGDGTLRYDGSNLYKDSPSLNGPPALYDPWNPPPMPAQYRPGNKY